ncbi:hypothetical protein Lal_00028867 [Lupinus albus]|uniref:Uncharacterized protein n=1 Tax=Lupinus albus TaxID=3870 RepID=A0A6A5NK03_LUPAL|nr:hypothetical protein Lalb_Chr19g0132111 [Lupinus albus]KAF1884978.1 hypothetical protein Lal_00028867 [Lupinus albus]
MAPVITFKSLSIVLIVALFSIAASAQDLSPASSPAPSPDAGAASSVSTSVAVIGASLLFSMLSVLNH